MGKKGSKKANKSQTKRKNGEKTAQMKAEAKGGLKTRDSSASLYEAVETTPIATLVENTFGQVKIPKCEVETDFGQKVVDLTKGVKIYKGSLKFSCDKGHLSLKFDFNVCSNYGRIIVNVLSLVDESEIKSSIMSAIEKDVDRGQKQVFTHSCVLGTDSSALFGHEDYYLVINTYGLVSQDSGEFISERLYLGVAERKENEYNVWIGYHAIREGVTVYVICRLDDTDSKDDDSYPKASHLKELGILAEEIGSGECGTHVYSGIYNYNPVIVKVRNNIERARIENEVAVMLRSGQHQNIVSFFGVYYGTNRSYLILEKCVTSFKELFDLWCHGAEFPKSDKKIELCSLVWNKADSSVLIRLIREILNGVAHLHSRKIVHGDIKPSNIFLYSDEFCVRAKVANFNNALRLSDKAPTASGCSTTKKDICGTCGWRAPEVIKGQECSYASDIFSCGLVFYNIFAEGTYHPFSFKGAPADDDITAGIVDLYALDDKPEFKDLISNLLVSSPTDRLTAQEANAHPIFWDDLKHLQFIQNVSDVINTQGDPLKILDEVKKLTQYNGWENKLSCNLKKELQLGGQSGDVLSLIKLIRNKYIHYEEYSEDLKRELGKLPSEYLDTFQTRFPLLVVDLYKVLKSNSKHPKLRSYYT